MLAGGGGSDSNAPDPLGLEEAIPEISYGQNIRWKQ